MDVRWLQDFLTVAERGNFTKAAEERNASQAAFSRRIQSLEAWLGATLIDRSVFPTRLTTEGERFKEHAADILRQVLDARADVATLPPRRSLVRIALPHALATGRLPAWWANWPSSAAVLGQIVPGNVHDTVTMLVAGSVDLLICFHHPQQPIHLDADRYERVVVGSEHLRPYAAAGRADAWRLPGKSNKPLPLLMYSSGAYLGRMVDLILEAAPVPLVGTPIMESDMAAVLAAMARQGHGIAWLPDCIAADAGAELSALDDDPWTMMLAVVAYRDRANASPALQRLWSSLSTDNVAMDRRPAIGAARRPKKGR